jgi:hypothetical protein
MIALQNKKPAERTGRADQHGPRSPSASRANVARDLSFKSPCALDAPTWRVRESGNPHAQRMSHVSSSSRREARAATKNPGGAGHPGFCNSWRGGRLPMSEAISAWNNSVRSRQLPPPRSSLSCLIFHAPFPLTPFIETQVTLPHADFKLEAVKREAVRNHEDPSSPLSGA